MRKYEPNPETGTTAAPWRVDIWVLPGSSLLSLACTGDPLRAANRLAGRKLFDWNYLSADGEAPPISAGFAFPVSGRLEPQARRDVLVVVAGFGARSLATRELAAVMRMAARQSRLVIGIESGAWLMARAGLLDGRRATTHWEDFEDFASAWPGVELLDERYVEDRGMITTSGASPTFDMMIELVRRRAGQSLALDVAGVFIYESARAANTMQTHASLGGSGKHHPKLVEAVRMMERRIDQPLPVAAIAKRLSISARGMEKLFLRELEQPPGAYYLALRLNTARKLVLDTRLPVTEIAGRTGFASLAAFSRAYSRRFGVAPAHERAAATARGQLA